MKLRNINTKHRVQTPCDKTTMTEQHHKQSCDINHIMAKYVKTGLLTHINENQPQYGDLTGLDFKQSMDLITEQTSKFMTLPAGIRAMFQNDPAQYLDLMTQEDGAEQLKAMLAPEPIPTAGVTEENTVEATTEPPTE